MSDLIVRKLFETRINAVSGALTAETAFENAPYKPKEGTAWQQVTLLPAEPENPTLGDGFYRAVGLMQVSLYYPKNAGPGPATTQAVALQAQFPRGLVLTEGVVRLRVARTPKIGPGRDLGAWYQLPVTIPYTADVNA